MNLFTKYLILAALSTTLGCSIGSAPFLEEGTGIKVDKDPSGDRVKVSLEEDGLADQIARRDEFQKNVAGKLHERPDFLERTRGASAIVRPDNASREQCGEAGGYVVEVGIEGEPTMSLPVCNGEKGDPGEPGEPVRVQASAGAPGCGARGGTTVQLTVAGQVTSFEICNGAQGPMGTTPTTPDIPPGAVMAFAGVAATPLGWLICDGRSLAQADYPGLYAAIGTAHGGNTTHFNLPDYRGRFLRGVDGGAGRDPDRHARTTASPGGASGDSVGTVQEDAITRHQHETNNTNDSYVFGSTGIARYGGTYGAQAVANTNYTNHFGSDETRPKNAGVIYIIKY